MDKLEKTLSASEPTLVAFIHAAESNAVDVKYILEELKKQYDGRARVIRVDSSYNRPVIERYKLSEYPTFILFKEGQELMRESGEKTVGELAQLIDRAL
ncbi:MAG: thioredoxin family protein [Bacteroidales bacterium]|nr:thioredoxin family protein [Bacteroidales bacterium]MBD5172595.1 thioredoxin family protein [Bacteroidales bacterium]